MRSAVPREGPAAHGSPADEKEAYWLTRIDSSMEPVLDPPVTNDGWQLAASEANADCGIGPPQVHRCHLSSSASSIIGWTRIGTWKGNCRFAKIALCVTYEKNSGAARKIVLDISSEEALHDRKAQPLSKLLPRFRQRSDRHKSK
jgi:hypothetical protein